jgi:hypothetical protein
LKDELSECRREIDRLKIVLIDQRSLLDGFAAAKEECLNKVKAAVDHCDTAQIGSVIHAINVQYAFTHIVGELRSAGR